MKFVPARFMQRIAAAFYDALIVIAIIFASGFVMSKLDLGDSYIGFLGLLFLIANYEPLLVALYGRTIGHRAAGIMVVGAGGPGVNYFVALFRYLLKVVLGSLSLIFMVLKPRQALHDMLTGTRVIQTRDGQPYSAPD